MFALDLVAESRIREALAAGTLDNPLAGQPIDLEADADVPRELRASLRLLKGAGYVPEELLARKQLLRLDDLLAACRDEPARRSLLRERSVAALRLELLLERRGRSPATEVYAGALWARVDAQRSG